MSKKILAVLAPVVAITTFMAIPSMAQATEAQCGGTQCAVGALVQGQASQLIAKYQEPTGELSCPGGGEIQGSVTKPKGATVESQITKFVLPQNCLSIGRETHVTTNAGNAGEDWTLQIQQPAGAEPGAPFVAHIGPTAGKKIQFTMQAQEFGFSVATCNFAATTVQLTGTGQSDTLTIDKTQAQFTLESFSGIGGSICGTVNTTVIHLEGSIQLETHTAGAAVVVHMAE